VTSYPDRVPFIDPDDMIRGSPLTGWTGRFFHSQNMTFAHWDIAEGAADLHEHNHEQEEVWHIVEGEIVLSVGGERRRLASGMAAVIPPGTPHSVSVTGPCRVIVADYPLRRELPGVRAATSPDP
jgi:quercetin dioxygenase-like cupin family protein